VAAIVFLIAGVLIWFGLQIGKDRRLQDRIVSPPVAVIETSLESTTGPSPTVPATTAPTPTATLTDAIEPAPTIAPVSAQVIPAPALQGMTIPDATRNLLQLGLRIAVDRSEFSNSVPMNTIIAQDPAPGTAIDAGGVVRVTLSRGPSPFGDNGNS
jgi:hypothetical protein